MPPRTPVFAILTGILFTGAQAAAQDPDSIARIWDGVFTTGQAARGQSEFDRVCARCHNLELTGSERGPAIAGDAFRANWENGTLGGLFARIRDTMPQGNPGTLDEAVKADVLAYILDRNGYPAGDEELRPDPASLDAVWILPEGVDTVGPQNYALVRVVGCLTPRPENRWALTMASAPAATPDETSPPGALERARTDPLGTGTIELISVRAAHEATRHAGRKMEARGLLYAEPGRAELNLTSLVVVDAECGGG